MFDSPLPLLIVCFISVTVVVNGARKLVTNVEEIPMCHAIRHESGRDEILGCITQYEDNYLPRMFTSCHKSNETLGVYLVDICSNAEKYNKFAICLDNYVHNLNGTVIAEHKAEAEKFETCFLRAIWGVTHPHKLTE